MDKRIYYSFMAFNNQNLQIYINFVVSQYDAVDSHSPYGQRTTVVCRKDNSTPQKYPREAGTPAKLPL